MNHNLTQIKNIFLFTLLSLLGCQQPNSEQFKFKERESNASILGFWEIFDYVENGLAYLDINNSSKVVEDMISINKQHSDHFSESDSLKVLARLDLLKENINDYYLNFYTSEKVRAGIVMIQNNSVVKYEIEGLYELYMDKLRIEMPDNECPIKIDGGYHWYVFKNQLRLYPNFINDKNTYTTYYLKK